MNNTTIPQTTDAPPRNLQPPPGANADIWEDGEHRPYRVVFGVPRGLTDRGDVLVSTTAIQFEDGQLDDGSEVDPPLVYVETNQDRGLTAQQARQLAEHLLESASEIDGWVAQ